MSPALVPLVVLLAAAPSGAPRPHPKVPAGDPSDACVACHAQRSPVVVREWESGPHGVLLVKCFVCHGSTGGDFARRPDPGRCGGCHPAQAAAVVPVKRGPAPAAQDCFSCHSPHTLAVPQGKQNPHPAK
jgi:hypothetical protein